VAISFVEWKAAETIVSGTTVTTPAFAATQAGDVIIFAGFGGPGTLSVKTNNNDPGTFGVLNGVRGAQVGTSSLQNFVGIIPKPTVGSTTVTLTQGTASQFKVLGVWVVRGMTNPTQDQGVFTGLQTGTINVSGLTGTLAATEEFGVGFTLTNGNTSSLNTGQTGSANFTYDGKVTNNAGGWSHQVTAATTAIQAAFNCPSGGGDCLCATYRSGPAWEYLGASPVVETTTTTHTLTEPANVVAGDLLVATIASRIASTTSITLPAGWTLVTEQKNNNVLTTSSATPSGMMAYIVRGASAPALTFTHPAAPSVARGQIVAYRGNDSVPLDTQSSFTTAVATTAVSGAGMTTTQATDLLVIGACGGLASAWSAFDAVTDPPTASGTGGLTDNPIAGTWKERQDASTATGADTSLAIADGIKATAGATGNLTATASISAAQVIVAGAFKLLSTGVTGTLTVTETADTAAFTGAVEWQAVLDATEAADTAAFTGSAAWTGVLDTTELPDTAAFTGAVEWQAILDTTEPADTASFTGDVASIGTLDTTEPADIAAFTGSVEWQAALDATENADIAAFTGNVEWQAALDTTEPADTADFTGTITLATITGTLDATESADTAAFTGAVEWLLVLDTTEAADTAAFTGLILDSITGILGATEDPDQASFIGDAINSAALTALEDPDIAAFTGEVSTPAILGAIEGADTVAFTGDIVVTRVFSQSVIVG
jgi:hypothetical protein